MRNPVYEIKTAALCGAAVALCVVLLTNRHDDVEESLAVFWFEDYR